MGSGTGGHSEEKSPAGAALERCDKERGEKGEALEGLTSRSVGRAFAPRANCAQVSLGLSPRPQQTLLKDQLRCQAQGLDLHTPFFLTLTLSFARCE